MVKSFSPVRVAGLLTPNPLAGILKYRDQLGRIVILVKPGTSHSAPYRVYLCKYISAENWDPCQFTIDHALASVLLCIDQAASKCVDEGLVFVVDMSGLRFAQMRQGTLSKVPAIASIVQVSFETTVVTD